LFVLLVTCYFLTENVDAGIQDTSQNKTLGLFRSTEVSLSRVL